MRGTPPQYNKATAQGVAERLEALDTVVEDEATVFGATLTAIEAEIGDNHEIGIDDVLDTLTATYTAVAPNEEFQLLTGDREHTPPQRMAYRSSTKLPPWM